jgi:hypothetical protein
MESKMWIKFDRDNVSEIIHAYGNGDTLLRDEYGPFDLWCKTVCVNFRGDIQTFPGRRIADCRWSRRLNGWVVSNNAPVEKAIDTGRVIVTHYTTPQSKPEDAV